MSHDILWPPLPYKQWEPTKQTLHRYPQCRRQASLGKVGTAFRRS
ncbi:MAG: hypothetical protein JWP18_978 [Solirubrobacterales bacterium]|nr:hypothetical protein [Solirubrobacterales bacterium]